MRNIETRMAVRETGGAEHYIYKPVSQEIGSIETSMEIIVQMSGQKSRARREWMNGRLGQETQQLA